MRVCARACGCLCHLPFPVHSTFLLFGQSPKCVHVLVVFGILVTKESKRVDSQGFACCWFYVFSRPFPFTITSSLVTDHLRCCR